MPHALLMLDDFAGAGLPTLREIAAAIERFKAAGKPVYAWGSDFDQRQYYLAAHATEVWLHPMGIVYIEGYGRYRNYYKDLLDRVGVNANVLRVGKFKNFARDLLGQRAFPEITGVRRRAVRVAVAELDRQRREGPPAAGRQRRAGHRIAARQPAGRRRRSGALGTGAQVGRRAEDPRRDARAAHRTRRARRRAARPSARCRWAAIWPASSPTPDGDAVGVIVAQGEISDGKAPAGRIGGLSTAELDPQGARRRQDQGHRAARQLPRRQRLRLRAGAARTRAHAPGRQAGGGVDGRRGGFGRLLDLDGRRRGDRRRGHHHRLDRRRRPAAHGGRRDGQAGRAHRRRHHHLAGRRLRPAARPSIRASGSWCRRSSTAPTSTSPRWPPRAQDHAEQDRRSGPGPRLERAPGAGARAGRPHRQPGRRRWPPPPGAPSSPAGTACSTWKPTRAGCSGCCRASARRWVRRIGRPAGPAGRLAGAGPGRARGHRQSRRTWAGWPTSPSAGSRSPPSCTACARALTTRRLRRRGATVSAGPPAGTDRPGSCPAGAAASPAPGAAAPAARRWRRARCRRRPGSGARSRYSSGAPSALSAKVVARRVSGISQTSNQPRRQPRAAASATVRLAPLTAM